uniref:Gustatory receptor n=1 Tax=Stomoxys calcitrans TaxID=35570 RepID=A0A454A0P4_STOCA
MRRSTKWMMTVHYYICLIMGIQSFCIDQATGRVYSTTIVSLYSALASMAMFTLLPLLYYIDFNSPYLHVQINGLLFVLRIIGLCVTIICNWIKRQEFMTTLRDLMQARDSFLKRWPLSEKLEQKYENTLRMKYFWGFATTVSMLLLSTEFYKLQFKLDSKYTLVAVMILYSVFHVLMMNYFLCMFHLNIMLMALNDEIKNILKMSCHLWQLQRAKQIGSGAFITQCCKLADDLDELAAAQYRLHLLGNRVYHMYDIQSACATLMVYLNSLSVYYMTYASLQRGQVLAKQYSTWSLMLVPIFLTSYYIDLTIFMFTIMAYPELYIKTGEMLRDCQPCTPTLDGRLEES